MVAPARLAAGLSGLRNRNARVTNKTQLRVVRGSVEADPIILDDEDDEKNRILASQGVDEEDANEHHLQAALFASAQRTLSTLQSRSANDINSYIPTPDAAGLVAKYDLLYPGGRHKDPATHIRFSDCIDESCVGGLSGSFTYFMDERDLEWLQRNNGAARGEGTSANGAANRPNGSNGANNVSRSVVRGLHVRSVKSKGKDPEHLPLNVAQPNIVVDKDHFELVMGLFEKWTDESISPYLHLSHDTEHFPDFSNFERLFSMPLLPATFANFALPPNLPHPEQMVRLARTIYPWWKERRKERRGHRIVPGPHILVLEAQEKEDKTGGSPYICFRKRDVKPVRKTRTNNATHTEKLTRLRGELQTSLELAQMVFKREKFKAEGAAAAESVWRSRESLADHMRQLNNSSPGSVLAGDESLLVDKERKLRKHKVETTASGRIILTNRRLSQARAGPFESLDPHSPLTLNGDTTHAFELCQTRPSARTAAIHREIDLELAKARKDDTYWEDVIDMPYQAPIPGDGNNFKSTPLGSASKSKHISTSDAQILSSHTHHPTPSVRLRIGRGGRLHFDRQLHRPKPHRLLKREWAGYPQSAGAAAQDDSERWARRSWRPRHELAKLTDVRKYHCRFGEDYWNRPRIYDTEEDAGVVARSSVEAPGDARATIIGFEQSTSDVHGARGPWLHARMGHDDESWKATPYLAVDPETLLGVEVPARNAMDRVRLVEARRGRTADDAGVHEGGALALFIDGSITQNNCRQEGRSRTSDSDQDFLSSDGRDIEATARAKRIEERWRYDSEGDIQVQESDDRFLLDDFQSKFMRTTITLLDAQDHDIIKTDQQYLTLPPPKQNRYLDHQLRLQNPGLPQPSGSGSTPMMTPKPPRPRQIPHHTFPLAVPSPLQNGNGVQAPLSLSPTQGPISTVIGSGNGNGVLISNSSVSPPKPLNGTNTLGLTPNGARIPPDSSAGIVRVSTPVRTKQALLNIPHPGLTNSMYGAPNSNGDASQGPFPPLQSYPPLKNALGRVLTGQQDPQQQGRPHKPEVNGVNVDETVLMNVPLGINNVLLSQRMPQLRPPGNKEHHKSGTS